MSGSASGGIPSPTRNSFPPITPLSGTVVRISIVFDEGTDQSGWDGSENEVARVLRDRDGFRDRLDARRKHGTGRNLQRRTLYASLPDNSIRSRRFQLQPNQCGPGGVPGERDDPQVSHSQWSPGRKSRRRANLCRSVGRINHNRRDRYAVAGLRVRGLTGTRSLVRELRGLICATMRSGDRRRKEVRPSLKEIADRAAAEAERQAIRLALHATRGNKSEAARLLRVDYKTLHLKTKRYSIEAAEFRAS
ncbi:MAG: hypothetical protein DMF83_12925 [Acidobacteria bacterium]|nr:MAG: hypothetical protein DMF83_12925 [Acidobacteriota bacterium]